ncbi:hypothetical protein WJX73_008874 [Symbiochloris irregularis]|uniref:Amino acid transporter transmembrane domain-containing protein n=1 Tax=Symbiochloris irregularis TaxID=706552 RepID=A0AAW1NMA4_9CHLO
MAVEPVAGSAATEPLLQQEQGATAHYRIIVEDADLPSKSNLGVSIPQAVFNLVNIYVGIGLLAMPYAFALSGWMAFAALLATAGLFCLSAHLIIKCFDKLDPGESHTYPALGTAALGPRGQYVVAAFAVAEFFTGSCLVIVVIWQELILCLPEAGVFGMSAFHATVVISLVAVLPLLLIPSFQGLSWLSLLGCCSTLVVVLTVAGVVAIDPLRRKMPHQPPEPHDVLRLGIVQASGIFAISLSGHSSLPALRNSMREPQKFKTVLNAGFISMLFIYAIVGGAGYWYWGRSVTALVTTDLARSSPFAGKSLLIPGVTVDRIVAACVLVNVYTTYPCLVLVIQDMVWSVMPWSQGPSGSVRAPLKVTAAAFRITVFLVGNCIAFAAYSLMGNVMSLMGGICSMCCSLLLPSSFFMLLYWRNVKPSVRWAVFGILTGGLALMVLITIENVLDIRHRLQATQTPLGMQEAAWIFSRQMMTWS